ncbi:MAG: hypothetical protein JSV26_12175 [bacterium]|nr:MAG: hypothetical protein JSV26_12175 [bacterium]
MIWPTVVTIRSNRRTRRLIMMRSRFSIGLTPDDVVLVNDPALLSRRIEIRRGRFLVGRRQYGTESGLRFSGAGRAVEAGDLSIRLVAFSEKTAGLIVLAGIGVVGLLWVVHSRV